MKSSSTEGLAPAYETRKKRKTKKMGKWIKCPKCGWYFLSRTGREKYCYHEECVKVREHEAKRAERRRARAKKRKGR